MLARSDMPTEAEIDRFMSLVQVLPCGCWYWIGARSRGKGNKSWYGSFWFRGRMIRAHRFAHDHLKGEPCPPGWHRDHDCRFTMCVNPDHIHARPRQDNMDRVGEHPLFTLARMATSWLGDALST